MKNNKATGLWIAGVIVALAIIVGVVGLLLPRGAGPEPTPSGTGPAATAGPSMGACNTEAGTSTTVPADLRWEASQGVTWPVSDTLGPTAEDDGFPVCFAQSPVGAALAAVTSMYAVVDHDPIAVGEFYLVDSPGKTIAIAEAKASDPVDLREQLAANGLTLVGFQVDAYTPERADIRVVLSVPESPTGYRSVPRTMVWVDGDWRVQLLDTGSAGQSTDVLAGQFVEWE